MRYGRILRCAFAAALAGCASEGNGAAGVNAICDVVQPPSPMPEGLDESSGLAIGRRDPTILWTHNDSGGDPRIFAVRVDGTLVGTVDVPGARNRDWEDMAAGPCEAGNCLYIGDIGDNLARRTEVTVYRVAEPEPGAGSTGRAERFRVRYPGGPRDAESLFVLPDGELYIVSKGRTSNIALYRYPRPFRAESTVELVHVVDLSAGAIGLAGQVTGAEASPNGEWVAVRSYAALLLYRTPDLLAGRPPFSIVDLAPVGESQGEAVAITDGGRVTLTSEASPSERSGSIAAVQCEV